MMNERVLFNDVAKEYIDYTAQNRNSTAYSYDSLFRKHIYSFAEGLYIQDVNKRTIRQLQMEMTEKRKADNTRYAPKTINQVTGFFQSVMGYATEYDYIRENPCAGFKKLKVKKNKGINFWDNNEFLTALSYEKTSMWFVVFTLTYMTGMRKGEVRGLKWKDFDYQKRTLTVRRHIDDKILNGKRDDAEWNVIEGRKNSGDELVLALADVELQMLMQWKKSEMQARGWSTDWYIFGRKAPLGQNTPNRHINKIADAAGIHRIKFHGLRHSHVSYLIDKGLNIYDIADRIGDTVEMVLKVYGHLFPNPQRKVVQALNNDFGTLELFIDRCGNRG